MLHSVLRPECEPVVSLAAEDRTFMGIVYLPLYQKERDSTQLGTRMIASRGQAQVEEGVSPMCSFWIKFRPMLRTSGDPDFERRL